MACDLRTASAHPSMSSSQPDRHEQLNRAFVERKIMVLISERRRRSSYFPGALFADPAWDILLLLALASARDHRLSVSKICSSVEAPMTTALRWITKLTSQGFLVRRHDPLDRRRRYIELSPEAYAMMAAYCSTVEPPLALAA